MKMASSSQVLTHRNPSHATDSFLRLSKLRHEGILCDLTILVQGQKFKVNLFQLLFFLVFSCYKQ